MTLLISILITALCIAFTHCLFWDGMLLAPVRKKYLSHLPLFWRKCTFECVVCMTSVYGLFCYAAASYYLGLGLAELLPFLFSVGGLLLLFRPLVERSEELYSEYHVLAELSKKPLPREGGCSKIYIVPLEQPSPLLPDDLTPCKAKPERNRIGYKVKRKPAVLKSKKHVR